MAGRGRKKKAVAQPVELPATRARVANSRSNEAISEDEVEPLLVVSPPATRRATSQRKSSMNGVTGNRTAPGNDLSATVSAMKTSADLQAKKTSQLERNIGSVRNALTNMETNMENKFDIMLNAITSLQSNSIGNQTRTPSRQSTSGGSPC